MRHKWPPLVALTVVALAVATLVVLSFRVGDTSQDVTTLKPKVDEQAATIEDIENLSHRIDRKADKTAVTTKRLKPQVTKLNRFVLGTPGRPGLTGRSIRGPRGITGLTTVGAQGGLGPIGPEGPLGAIGATGPPGSAGEDGAEGPKGDTGANGADGAQGPGPSDAEMQAALAAFFMVHTLTCEPTADLLDPPNKQTCTVDFP